MSDRKLAKAVQRLFRQIWKLYRSLSKTFVTWLLRSAMLPSRRRRATAGFVLPTTVFLVLVVTLTSGALTYRAFNNSSRAIGNVQSREVYNAATPAIDRARVKLDALFADPRYPGGVPSEGFLTSMMLNDGRQIKGTRADVQPGVANVTQPNDPFTFLNEARVDINKDGQLDNAWMYHDDQNKATIIYSITFSTPSDDSTTAGWQRLLTLNEQDKANGAGEPESGPFIRTGPLGSDAGVNCRVAAAGSPVEQGWYKDTSSTAKLRKRFQVDAFVVKDNAVNPGQANNFTTLEFAQDRLLDRGNKWGAWFRNDLEVYPGADFNWNGAMHSEGSLLIGGKQGPKFNAYLISSPRSCLFLPEENSEISVRQVTANPALNQPNDFFGVIGTGQITTNSFSGDSFPVHRYNGNNPDFAENLNPGTDWIASTAKNPIDLSLKPEVILTQDGYEARSGSVSNVDIRLTDAAIASNVFAAPKRFKVDTAGTRPYIDDTYRADNLYGPKKVYKDGVVSPDGTIGTPITASDSNFAALTREAPAGSDTTTVGLDGYWERRSIVEGLRLLVGERLELGNPAGWVTPKNRTSTPSATQLAQQVSYAPPNEEFGSFSDNVASATPDSNTSDNEGDALYPPYRVNDSTRAHEERERKALRDNLAAVQATAIYHHSINGGTYPAACLATTAHPGTVDTLRRSVDFSANSYLSATDPWVDFFSGNGTNGWEFSPPAATESDFANQVAAGQPLGNALRNLANLSGDPDGAYPAQQGTRPRPDKTLTMWGNYSNLRRAITKLNAGGYNSLSPADKTYLHTASCTLGMLAYNINQAQVFNLASVFPQDLTNLGTEIFGLMDGSNANGGDEVLPGLIKNDPAQYNPRDYDNITPAMFLAKLKERANQGRIEPKLYQLAVLIHEHFQIRRDRLFGFRPSPAANTWNYNPYVLVNPEIAKVSSDRDTVTLWSSACDPTVFQVNDPLTPANLTANSAKERLGLSRLCGTVIPPGTLHNATGDTNFPARNVDAAFTPNPDKYTPDPKESFDTPGVSAVATFDRATNSSISVDPRDLRATVAPEFPALYYLFPEENHDHDGAVGAVDHRQPGNSDLDTDLQVAFQPWKEPYITNPLVPSENTASNVYQVVSSGAVTNAFDAASSPIDVDQVAGTGTSFKYRAFTPFTGSTDVAVNLNSTPKAEADWTIPPIAPDVNSSPNRIRKPNGDIVATAFQDKVMFNGREWQPSRVLDLDLDLLRRSSAGGDAWLPKSGIVYAFREDAVREDAIARPAGTVATPSGVRQSSVVAVVGGGSETDPPVAAGEISTKPVDYIADPDRRVHGFRLRNGEKLKRLASVPDNENKRGLSFFSDNLAYIMGDFNKHQNAGGSLLEEFTEQLNGAYDANKFYGRSTRDPDFAIAETDEWRPSEVLADTVTILSRNFCDGGVEDTFINSGQKITIPASKYNTGLLFAPGCTDADGRTSFLNQNRPSQAPQAGLDWAREIPGNPQSPVKISRNGNPLVQSPSLSMPVEYAGTYNSGRIQGDFYNISGTTSANDDQEGRSLQESPPETTVNTIMISGIVPSRNQQGYGGLHNFPRFLERWQGQNVRFSGSFIQLNFSNYGTAPYDQDVWEPGSDGQPPEVIDYYAFAPNRLWGYDVGLQIAPAGPAANRFVQLSTVRNEFYNEPAANDFYMQNLCQSLKANAAQVPNASLNLNGIRCPA